MYIPSYLTWVKWEQKKIDKNNLDKKYCDYCNKSLVNSC